MSAAALLQTPPKIRSHIASDFVCAGSMGEAWNWTELLDLPEESIGLRTLHFVTRRTISTHPCGNVGDL